MIYDVKTKSEFKGEVKANFNAILEPEVLLVVVDSEYTTKDKIRVDSIQIYIPKLSELVYIATSNEGDITNSFNPILDGINNLSNKTLKIVGEDEAGSIAQSIDELADNVTNYTDDIKTRTHQLKKSIEEGEFDKVLKPYNIPKEQLKVSSGKIVVEIKTVKVDLVCHYMQADIFKIFGKNWHHIFKNSPLIQNSTVGFLNKQFKHLSYIMLEDVFCKVQFTLRDTMHRIPPKNKSLDGQCQIYQVEVPKLNNSSLDKTNMTKMLEEQPDLFLQYAAQDTVATYCLLEKQKQQLKRIYKSFSMVYTGNISDTLGSNVSTFIKHLLKKHFIQNDKDINKMKVEENIIREQLNLGHIKHISESTFTNQFGTQGLKTVGGLLFSRMPLHQSFEGRLADLDEESCYGTVLSNMNIYLGEPIVASWMNAKDKWKLKDIIPLLEQFPNDGWNLRVSGKFKQVVNTLINSDRSFVQKKILMSESINTSNMVQSWNIEKEIKQKSDSVLFSKEVKFGLISHHVLNNIKLMPEDWQEEYLNLKVDFVIGYPKDMLCKSIDELEKKKALLPEVATDEKLNSDFTMIISNKRYKKNVALVFPIGSYMIELKNKRKCFKSKNDPIQEVFKLFINTTYGVLSSQFLPTNNSIAANYITSTARAATWMMLNGLNGFQAITDGTTFSWDHIPTNTTFKSILSKNSEYLLSFDENHKSNISKSEHGQEWINTSFKDHINNFFECRKSVVDLFDFTLKDETFISNKGKVTTTIFTKIINSSSGDYLKIMDGKLYLADADLGKGEYIFDNESSEMKARGFRTDSPDINGISLASWYKDILENDCYKQLYIYKDNGLYGLNDGNQSVARHLSKNNVSKVIHPLGTKNITYSIPKLIRRSQFVFQSEKQLINFESNQYNLGTVSKGYLSGSFWARLVVDDIKEYGAEEMIEGLDYHEYAKYHGVGIGFEILTLNKRNNNSVKNIRQKIYNAINQGTTDFNSSLNISRCIRNNRDRFKYILAAVIVMRCNEDHYEMLTLVASSDEETLFTLTPDDINSSV